MASYADQAQVETVKDFGDDPEGLVKRWVAEINMFEEESKDWVSRGEKIIKIYRDERDDANRAVRKFALLWSNVETLKPALYARLPKADVQRRFKDADAVSRLACEIAERALDYTIDCTDRFDRMMRDTTEDYLLPGIGIQWQRYIPHFRTEAPYPEKEEAVEGTSVTNDADEEDSGAQPEEVMDYEEVVDDYVNWRDFGWNSGARTWDEVYAVWRKAFLTRAELKERFGEDIGSKISLDYTPRDDGKVISEETKDLFKKATVYEIWDKSSRQVYWVSKTYNESPLDVKKDPLNLSGFFPCQRPLFATQSNGTLIPIPDYVFYQDQAEEVNDLTARIGVVEKAIRVRGVYAADTEAMKVLLQDAMDNDMVPVSMNELRTMGIEDLSKAVWFWPLDILVNTLKTLVELRTQLIEDVYQITGLSDILRGETDPNETLGAQQLKAQSGGRRIKTKQEEIQRFARDALRIKFEIIFNLFSDESVWAITNAAQIPDIKQAGDAARAQAEQQMMMAQQNAQMQGVVVPPNPQMVDFAVEQAEKAMFSQAMALLRDQNMRMFRVDVETDSTVAADEQADKAAVTELLTGIGGFLTSAGPIVQQLPEFGPVMGELLMFAVRRFHAGQSVEAAIETAVEKIMQKGSAPQQDNSLQVAQTEQQTKQMEIQGRLQEQGMKDQEAAKDRVMEQGRMALEGLAMERDPEPQSVVVQ